MDYTLWNKRSSRHKLSLQRRLYSNKKQQTQNSSQSYLQRRKSTGKSLHRIDSRQPRHLDDQNNNSNSRHIQNNHNNDSGLSLRKKSTFVDSSSSQLFLRAKSLYKQFKLNEASKEFEKVLINEPDHAQALYLLGISQLNMNLLSDAARTFERLLNAFAKQSTTTSSSSNSYRLNVYLFLAICYNKLKNIDKALNILATVLSKQPDYLQALCYRGKIYLSLKRFSKAEEEFDAALAIDPNKQISLMGKADALRGRGLDKEAVKFYSLALQKGFNQSILLKRAICYYQSEMFKECQLDITKIIESQRSGQALYYQGLLYLADKNETKAIMSFEEAIRHSSSANSKIAIKCCEELLKIKVQSCDFYECTTILQWIRNLGLTKGLEPWSFFVEGVVCLMKKKYSQADDCLRQLQNSIAEQKSHFLFPYLKLYRGYGLLCLYKYEQSYDYFSEYERYLTSILGREVDEKAAYNKTLTEALMLCDCEFFEQSIQKLDELIKMSPTKHQPYFYKAIIYFKIAFCQAPFIYDLQGKQQILLASLDILQNTPQLKQLPLVGYFCTLIKVYFELYEQAEQIITKSIQKGQDHLANYFHLRCLISSLLDKKDQAISDVTISINIQEKPEFYLDRCRLYQLESRSEEAYADLQKYIQLEPNQHDVSKWACIILFSNRAFEEAEKTLLKIDNYNSSEHSQLKPIVERINILNGRFSDGGLEGELIQHVVSNKDNGEYGVVVDIDKIIAAGQLNRHSYGYLRSEYIYYLRAVKHYVNKNYTAAIKDLQYILFLLKDQEGSEMVVEVKYSIMICHLLNDDPEKVKNLRHKGLSVISDRLDLLDQISDLQQAQVGDLSEFFPERHLSEYLPYALVPNTKVKVKISVPFPDFPYVNGLELRLSQEKLVKAFSLQAVESNGEAPWIRKASGMYQFTSKIESNSISLQTSNNTSILR